MKRRRLFWQLYPLFFLLVVASFFLGSLVKDSLLWVTTVIVMSGALCWWLALRLSKPIEVLKNQAQKISFGDFSNLKGAHLIAPSEIYELGKALDELATQLDQKIKTVVAQKNEREALFSSMIEGVLSVDRKERVTYLNEAASHLLEISEKDSIRRPIQEVIRNPDLLKFILDTLKNRESEQDEITVYGNQQERFIQIQCSPLKDPNAGVVIVFNDITRLRRLENHRRDFVANVSHELKTPLTSIQGFVETLLSQNVTDPKEQERFLKIVEKHATRLGQIIDELLTLSRLEKESEIELFDTNLHGILSSAIDVCATKAKKQEIAVQLECASDLKVRANSALLEQAVVNLVDNAIKYSDLKTEVRVKAAIQENELVVSVEDQGQGIPQEHLPRLFERFYRVDKARSRNMGGTGLGLSIVKHIVAVHHGRVEAESESGKGSRFSIRLPQDHPKASLLK